ncbi:MAG: SAM-dependent methyltransferase [Candidatus Azobacteroides sp.]|nr:SAM-dependent methyltransferase [Candidatus Azobacteroides sp.]
MTILNRETKDFIEKNKDKEIAEILLKKNLSPDINLKLAVQQIEGRKKAKNKLPSFVTNDNFIFPEKLSLEQCSSEATAQYKASICKGGSLIDVTGGLGIDCIFMAAVNEKVTYIEKNKNLFDITVQNFSALHIQNIIPVCTDSASFLSGYDKKFDWLYADPARRDVSRNKVFLLTDCEPDVVKHMPLFFSKAEKILLKVSPMLDISRALRELNYMVSDIHILSVKNDCKELLFVCCNQHTDPLIHCVNIGTGKTEHFCFRKTREEEANVLYADNLEKYLYEPNVTVLKAGAFKLISEQFGLKKLHVNTHLYTNDKLVEDFPGRIFRIKEVLYSFPGHLYSFLPDRKANITVRNFPLSVEEIRKKYKIKEGSEIYLFATTIGNNKKIMLICENIK